MYLNCKDDWRVCDKADSAEAFFDGFDGVLNLEKMAVGWEDGDGSIVHLNYFQIIIKSYHYKHSHLVHHWCFLTET